MNKKTEEHSYAPLEVGTYDQIYQIKQKHIHANKPPMLVILTISNTSKPRSVLENIWEPAYPQGCSK